MALHEASAPRSLHRRWLAAAALGSACLLAGCAILLTSHDLPAVLGWLLAASAVLGYQAVFVGRRLGLNRRPGETRVLPEFGPGNALTLARGVLLAMLAGFLVLPRPQAALAWAPAVLYMTADVADYFDGYLARISRHATLLGQALDLEFDALGLLIGVGVAIHLGQLPAFFLVLGVARYAFVFGTWALARTGRRERPLPESVSRRPIAGLTMAFVSAVLWPIVIPPAATLAGVMFAIPFAASFGRDWLVVSGMLDPASDGYRAWRRRLKHLLLHVLPAVLRLPLTVIAAVLTTQMLSAAPLWLPTQQAMMIGLQVMCTAGIALGLAGRVAALGLLFPLGLAAYADGLPPLRAWSLGLTLAILILGTGALSLWKPEEGAFRRRAGDKDG